MTVDNLHELDAHEQPSDQMKALWKSYSKAEQKDILGSQDVDDLHTEACRDEFITTSSIRASDIKGAFSKFDPEGSYEAVEDAPMYYHELLPGLLIVPGLIPPSIQKRLLSKVIHRDLSHPPHQTNLHLHFNLPYPPLASSSPPSRQGASSQPPPSTPTAPHETLADEEARSFFTYPPNSSIRFAPLDPTVHRPLTIKQVLNRRLHWVTLGGQYDWTARVYPSAPSPPAFPADIRDFLETLFPQTKAQAAIVNFYGPGDTMMMHRDVSEEVNRGLVSLSMGCDALFMITPNDIGLGHGEEEGRDPSGGKEAAEAGEERGEAGTQEAKGQRGRRKKQYLLLRLRSGDAIYMTNEARYAWHGVPKVLKGTCPQYLRDWPAEGGKFPEWKGWLSNKRINLNVRQMKD